MEQYKVVIYQEPILSSLLFWSAKINPIKFSELLNENAKDWWVVQTMSKENRRIMLFWSREAQVVIMKKAL